MAIPMKDTPKQAGPDRQIQRTLDRNEMWLAQTPQTFQRDMLLEAYEKAAIERLQATDDAALVERLGHKVGIVAGTWENIKITTPEDLVIAEAILTARAGKACESE